MSLLRSILHNIGVIIVGFGVAMLGKGLDHLFHFREFHSTFSMIAGCLLLIAGFLLRVWAAFYFYEQRMKVIVLHAQSALVTCGPFRLSRNPLYLGGNVFIFFGAALCLGTPAGLLITALHLPLVDLMIRREERQLEARFGEAWVQYKKHVRRWL